MKNRQILLMGSSAIVALSTALLTAGSAEAACPGIPGSNVDTGIVAISFGAPPNDIKINTFGVFDVAADNAGHTSSLGIYACADSGGAISILTGASLLSHDGPGIEAFSTLGSISITHGSGQILGGAGDAIAMKSSAGGSTSLTVSAGTDVFGSNDGVSAIVTDFGSNLIVTKGNITGAGDVGIQTAARSGATAVLVQSGAVSGLNAGIHSTSLDGSVTIDNAAAVSGGGKFGLGVDVATVTGPVNVSNGVTGLISGGVRITTGGGAAKVDNLGAISALGRRGIDVQTGAGAIQISLAKGGAVSSAGEDGVFALSSSGAVSISSSGQVAAGGIGIRAISGAAAPTSVSVAGGTINGGSGAVAIRTEDGAARLDVKGVGTVLDGAAGIGATVVSTGAGDVFVSSDLGSVITSKGGAGVFALATTGKVTLNLAGAVSTTTAFGGNGVVGQQNGGAGALGISTGAVTASATGVVGLNNGTGATAVTTNGVIQAGGNGVQASANTLGGGPLTVTVKAGVNAGLNGVDATNLSKVSGVDVVLTNGAAVFAGNGFGIRARATAPTGAAGATVTLTGGAVVTAPSGDGIIAGTGGSGLATVSLDVGTGVSAKSGVGVNASSAGGDVTVSIAKGAVVNGGAAGLVAQSGGRTRATVSGSLRALSSDHSGVAISASTGGGLVLRVAPGGLLDGRIQATDNVSFRNRGQWLTSGLSDFGTSKGAGSNSLTNLGLIQVGADGPAAAAMSTTFAHLGAFNNGSSRSTGVISMVNGRAGDSLTISGAFTGESGHSVLVVDAFLGGPGSMADVLHLNGSSGRTSIIVNDVNPGPGALNKAGITLVTGVTGRNGFVIDPSTPNYDRRFDGIDHGFYLYELDIKGGTAALTSRPGVKAAHGPSLMTAAQQIFNATGLDDRLAEAITGDRLERSEHGEHRFWMNASNWRPSRLSQAREALWDSPLDMGGGGLESSTEVGRTFLSAAASGHGPDLAMDAGYAQNTASLISGADLVRRSGPDTAFVLGLVSGYVQSDVTFNVGQDSAAFDGAVFGVYSSYRAGGLRLDGDLRGNFMRVRYAADRSETASTTHLRVVGANLAARYRFDLGARWRFEPEIDLAASGISADDLAAFGQVVRFTGGQSLRTSVGARLAGDLGNRAWRVDLSAEARLVNEWAGRNGVVIGLGEDALPLNDTLAGVYGDLSTRLDVGARNGRISGFVSAAVRERASFSAATASGGFRFRW